MRMYPVCLFPAILFVACLPVPPPASAPSIPESNWNEMEERARAKLEELESLGESTPTESKRFEANAQGNLQGGAPLEWPVEQKRCYELSVAGDNQPFELRVVGRTADGEDGASLWTVKTPFENDAARVEFCVEHARSIDVVPVGCRGNGMCHYVLAFRSHVETEVETQGRLQAGREAIARDNADTAQGKCEECQKARIACLEAAGNETTTCYKKYEQCLRALSGRGIDVSSCK